MTRPSEPPRFFLDRGLGARVVPEGLRARGWLLTTMDERYGAERSQDVADIDWIREASGRGECLLTKDTAIARHPAEAEMVYQCDARVFTVTNAQIAGPVVLERLVLHEVTIMRWASRTPAPFVLGLGPRTAQRMRLNLPWLA